MKKSYKFLIISIGLVAIGFGMDEMFAYVPFSTNPQLTQVSIAPNSDYSFQINSKGETKMSGVFSGIPKENSINLKIFNPDQTIIWEGNSVHTSHDSDNKQFITLNFFNPNSQGSLDAVITNLGNQQVIVDGGIHDFVEYDPDKDELEAVMDVYSEILLYSILASFLKLIGIVFGVVGIVFFLKERSKQN